MMRHANEADPTEPDRILSAIGLIGLRASKYQNIIHREIIWSVVKYCHNVT